MSALVLVSSGANLQCYKEGEKSRMKITKTAAQVKCAETNKTIANVGCNICPCCGETKSTLEYNKEDIFSHKGIASGTYKSWCAGLFRTKRYRIDCYHCYTCGAEWESEPYEI